MNLNLDSIEKRPGFSWKKIFSSSNVESIFLRFNSNLFLLEFEHNVEHRHSNSFEKHLPRLGCLFVQVGILWHWRSLLRRWLSGWTLLEQQWTNHRRKFRWKFRRIDQHEQWRHRQRTELCLYFQYDWRWNTIVSSYRSQEFWMETNEQRWSRRLSRSRFPRNRWIENDSRILCTGYHRLTRSILSKSDSYIDFRLWLSLCRFLVFNPR